jgi:pimeloyl-ACP methyl ester carboxylesterase
MDLAGHGASEMYGEPPFIVTQEEMSAQLMSLLDSLGVEQTAMAGSSIGGCVATVCAALWPDRVSGLITVGSALAGSADRAGLKEAAEKAIADGLFDEKENPLPRDPSYMERIFGMQSQAHMEEMTLSRKAAGRWIQPSARGVGVFDYLKILPRVEAPMLMIDGSRGGYGRFVDDALELVANGRSATIEDASAFPHQDKPEETATEILAFLEV